MHKFAEREALIIFIRRDTNKNRVEPSTNLNEQRLLSTPGGVPSDVIEPGVH